MNRITVAHQVHHRSVCRGYWCRIHRWAVEADRAALGWPRHPAGLGLRPRRGWWRLLPQGPDGTW